ncbi:MAG TPA: hypothetical protein VK655_03710, partial [Solirubrobacteraceae bacterium]|nr:hypothetical protein [Solirubrobacteraceae bacterium]
MRRREHTCDGPRGSRRIRGLQAVAVLVCALAGAGTMPAAVLAAPSAAAPASASAPAPAAVPAPVAAPAGGAMRLTLHDVGGKPLLALVGSRIEVQGSVSPYVAGQKVEVGFYLNGRKLAASSVSVLAAKGASGSFRVGFSSHYAGSLQARAVH